MVNKIRRAIEQRVDDLEILENIASKSKLTKKDAEEISKKIKKLPKISLSPQQATEYSLRNFSLSATSNFSLSKSATASCGVLNPDLEIK